ncbi:MAG: NADH-quinone oxidoreductase subunit C [Ignavibacteriae bacterium]|nr:NADH-quinone oxidoreductase subunit C [Ignavibacteriota bacterium]
MIPQEICDALKAKFPDVIKETKIEGVFDPYVKVAPEKVKDIAQFLRDDDTLAFDSLMCLSGIDYTGGKFGVVYHLHSIKWNHKITLKVEATLENMHCQSVESIWKTANWHEREAFDMYGIIFDGHTDLRRILMPYDWEGHPLRKDYKVPEYYNGMKVPY